MLRTGGRPGYDSLPHSARVPFGVRGGPDACGRSDPRAHARGLGLDRTAKGSLGRGECRESVPLSLERYHSHRDLQGVCGSCRPSAGSCSPCYRHRALRSSPTRLLPRLLRRPTSSSKRSTRSSTCTQTRSATTTSPCSARVACSTNLTRACREFGQLCVSLSRSRTSPSGLEL